MTPPHKVFVEIEDHAFGCPAADGKRHIDDTLRNRWQVFQRAEAFVHVPEPVVIPTAASYVRRNGLNVVH